MKPFRNLAQARTPGGAQLSLHEHDGEFFLKLDGKQLMSSSSTVSELDLARIGCEGLNQGASEAAGSVGPRILIGGLGFGFTLRGVLERVGDGACIHVAELIPEVVTWNRELLPGLNGALLDDCRVSVIVDDVLRVIRKAQASENRYDAILLDVDNGPVAMVQGGNSRLYNKAGFELIAGALNPGGKVVFWSASPDAPFVQRLSNAGFRVESFASKAHERAKRAEHAIYRAEPVAAVRRG